MRDYFLLLIFLSLVPTIFWRPWLGILAWYWVAFMVPHAHSWGFMRTFPTASLVGGATLIAIFIAKDRRPIPMKREMVMMFVWLSFMTLTTLFAVNPDEAWSQWQKVFKILLITFIAPILIYGERRIIFLLLTITLSIGFYGFKGGLFGILTGGQHQVLGPPGNSFISGNTFIGIAMIMVLPLLLVSARLIYRQWVNLGLPWLSTWSRPLGLFLYGVFWLTALAILVTYSRGALLGLLAIFPFLFIRMQRKPLMVLSAFLAVTIVGVTVPDRLMARWQTIETYEEDTSAMQRIQSWGVNWNMAVESPILGMGFSHQGNGYGWWIQYANFEGTWKHVLSPHSLYFQLLGEHGFVGLGVFLLLIGLTFFTLRNIERTARLQDGPIWIAEYAWAIKISLMGYMIAGAFIDVAYFDLLYALIALTIVMRRELDETSSPTLTPVDQHLVHSKREELTRRKYAQTGQGTRRAPTP